MALAYTPGLKIKELTVVQKTRKLPIKGDILVKQGEKVNFDTIVARAEIPGHVDVIPAAQLLQVDPADINVFMLKQVGSQCTQGEVIARRSSFFGLSKATCIASCDGTLEYISDLSGQVTIRRDNIPIDLNAYITGNVSQVLPDFGVVIETSAAFIQGIYGIGAEAHGDLIVISDSAEQEIVADDITPECKDKIAVGGASITVDALTKLVEVGASGFISGGIDSEELLTFTGGKLGFGVTGFEDINITLIVTEGFGSRSIADKTYNILKTFDGKETSINGETQIRAGVVRPEIIIPRPENKIQDVLQDSDVLMLKGMELGMMIRSIRAPYFGEIGFVTKLNAGLETVETGSQVRVLEMKLKDGRTVTVPRANVEIIE
jgi:hypothetical protein